MKLESKFDIGHYVECQGIICKVLGVKISLTQGRPAEVKYSLAGFSDYVREYEIKRSVRIIGEHENEG